MPSDPIILINKEGRYEVYCGRHAFRRSYVQLANAKAILRAHLVLGHGVRIDYDSEKWAYSVGAVR